MVAKSIHLIMYITVYGHSANAEDNLSPKYSLKSISQLIDDGIKFVAKIA